MTFEASWRDARSYHELQ